MLRAISERKKIGEINGIPLYSIEYKLPQLPEEQKGVYYIVSSIVLSALKMHGIKRYDIIAPDTNRAIRDEKGRIIGVRGFIRVR